MSGHVTHTAAQRRTRTATTKMEVSPFSFAPERYWTEEKERALIAFFSKHSCLWNHKSESYKNRQLRWRTLEHLRMRLSAHPPPVAFTVEDIKNKFKNLRTTFQRQYKLVRASRVCRSDDVFVPQWKHYEQLMFLQGCWDRDGPAADDRPLSPLEDAPQPALAPSPSPGLIISFLPTPSAPFPSTSSTSSSSVSCIPTNMMVKCYWTEERERALIAFYSDHNCLWNKKSENHNNRQLRLRLLEALRDELSDHQVTFSVEDIKCKFKNLRTVFNREFKAVQASRTSDKLYTSKWKHYQQLLFLCESCDEDEGGGGGGGGGGVDDPQVLTPRDDPDHGNRTPSSTYQLAASSSSSTSTLSSPPPPPPSSSSSSSSSSASPLDSKPSGPVQLDSRCLWSDSKVQQLISFYSEHSCLWNHKCESYRNRLLRQSLLETLSGHLSHNEPVPFTVEDVKTKFRNLRTIFQREHRAVSSNKTCGSEDFYLPRWRHYGELMFLCDSCDEEERTERLPFLLGGQEAPPPPHLPLHHHHHHHAASQTHLGLAPPSPTPPDSRHSSPSSSSSSSSPSPSPPPSTASSSHSRKRASRRAPPPPPPPPPPPLPPLPPLPTSGEVLDLVRALCRGGAGASPHAGFLRYVEECLNETPPDKVKKLKKKIIETIHSAAEEG